MPRSTASTATPIGATQRRLIVGIVIDEVVAFLLVLFFAGVTPLRIAFAFVLFRFFDIVKPPPIRQVDAALKNGVGVMLDDILAAGYALIVFALASRLVS